MKCAIPGCEHPAYSPATLYVLEAVGILVASNVQITERRISELGRILAWLDSGSRGKRARMGDRR